MIAQPIQNPKSKIQNRVTSWFYTPKIEVEGYIHAMRVSRFGGLISELIQGNFRLKPASDDGMRFFSRKNEHPNWE